MSQSKYAEGTTESGAGWRIHYTVQGNGPDLVLLHGGGPGATGASNYARNIEHFAQHFRTWVIDFPGWGRSSKNLHAFGALSPFFNGGRAVKAFLDAVDIDKAHVVGNSFGGSACYALAIEQPQRVNRIVAMGPGGAWVEGVPITEGILQLLTYYTGEGPTREKLAAFLRNLVHDPAFVTPELVEARFAASNDPEITANPPLRLPPGASGPPAKHAHLSEHPRLATLPHRCLMVWGRQDKVNVPQGAESFGRIPDQDIVFFNNTGHWVQWEQADKFNELVTWFLQRA